VATIDGGAGNDSLVGTFAQDVIRGFGGDDTIRGEGNSGSGPELLFGGDGSDSVVGGANVDWLYGDSGDGTLEGGGSNDVLSGGIGDDEFVAAGSSLGFDQINGDDGFDTLTVKMSGTVLGFKGYFGSQTVEVIDATGYSSVVILAESTGASYDFSTTALLNISAIEGQGGADFITGSYTNDVIRGAGGNDVFFVQIATNPFTGLQSTGNDSLDGGSGSDSAVFGPGIIGTFTITQNTATTWNVIRVATGAVEYAVTQTPSIAGSWSVTNIPTAETTTLTTIERLVFGDFSISAYTGTAGNDVFAATTTSRWSLTGLAGNDSLTGNSSDDVLAGGSGADTLDGASGIDLADYGASAAAVTVSLDLAAGTAQTSGGDAAGDVLSNIEAVAGSAFNDTLTGGAGADKLLGNDGDDRLRGAAGADTLQGGAGIDTAVYTGSTAVTVVLGAATQAGGDAAGDSLDAIENVTGSGQGDSLTGDAGINRLEGAGGKDTLTGGGGADSLDGGTAADRFVYAAVSDSTDAARDRILDFSQVQGDLIDLAAIDADVIAAGDQGFAFIGSAAFSASGVAELRWRQAGGNTFVEADFGDGVADFSVRLTGMIAVAAGDLVL